MTTFKSPNTLMIQGTTSDAGKSVLVAGLCRVLARKQLSVAPFKPQNMALNSAVTVDGGEIGRSQAMQAIACGLEPHTDMNPVLLKPSTDTQAQVIIHGKVAADLGAQGFHDYKKIALSAVLESFERLQQQYDFVVVEGAGSPAEINLRENDIANMGFAEAVDCPVIIVADIDRGGVFAHLVGTLDCLSESEQNRIVGFVINRFRGDISLLQSGLDWLEEKTGKPVLGVLPYLQNFYLDAEDAIALSQRKRNRQPRLKIAVPVFSRISNHTDFDSLRLNPDIDLIFVGPEQNIPSVDLIILPGTKNVRGDLALLKQWGWDQSIKQHLRYGGKLIGICGGYQMLGEWISDAKGIEGEPGRSQGLGFLPMTTELQPQKILKQIQGQLLLDELDPVSFSGYEIHCGVSHWQKTTESTEKLTPLLVINGIHEGIISSDQQIIGTYVHGLFDEASAAQKILQWAGLHTDATIDIAEHRQTQLDRFADCLEEQFRSDFWARFSNAKTCE